MHDVLTVLLTAGASALAAWWGGKLGVRREGEKLAQARAFDRRLEWYERALKILLEYRDRTVKFCDATWRGHPEQPRFEREYLNFVQQANDVLNEGVLYGRRSTLDSFKEMKKQFVILSSKPTMPSELEAFRIAVTVAWFTLVGEAREHLCSEPLEFGQEMLVPTGANFADISE